MSHALHAEWTKLRTLAATGWLLLGTVALTVALERRATLATTTPPEARARTRPSSASPASTSARRSSRSSPCSSIGGEYSTGMIRITLAAIPRRASMLAAKAAILHRARRSRRRALAVLGSLLAGRLILPAHGFTTAHGYPALPR